MNINLQSIATKSLRNGLIQYDQRRGYRGPLTNKKYTKDWHKDLEKFNCRI